MGEVFYQQACHTAYLGCAPATGWTTVAGYTDCTRAGEDLITLDIIVVVGDLSLLLLVVDEWDIFNS